MAAETPAAIRMNDETRTPIGCCCRRSADDWRHQRRDEHRTDNDCGGVCQDAEGRDCHREQEHDPPGDEFVHAVGLFEVEAVVDLGPTGISDVLEEHPIASDL